MGRSRYKIGEPRQPHFLTCTVVGWLPVFTRPETVEIVLNSWRFLQAQQRLVIYGYAILENHLHLIASAEDLGKEIGDFKSFTARNIIDFLEERKVYFLLKQLEFFKARHKTDRTHQFWLEGSHPELIADDEMMWQKLEYMHNNPVKRGYVDDPVHWRYSSARNYAGQQDVLEVKTDWWLPTAGDAERRGRHSHAERGNEGNMPNA
jgi:REP element-mobilizing transposase RayT